MINNFNRLGAPAECLVYDPPEVSDATINGRVTSTKWKNGKLLLKYFHDSITLQIRLDLKYISNAANQFEDLVSEWTIFVHEKDQIAWDYSNLFGSSYLGFFDSHIPMYNETFSIFSPYTILYNDVTHLSKEDRPCTDDPGYFDRECSWSNIFTSSLF